MLTAIAVAKQLKLDKENTVSMILDYSGNQYKLVRHDNNES